MEQFTQEMMSRLDALANKLGMAASAIWSFYLRQARVEGISDLIMGFVFLLLSCLGTWYLIHQGRKENYGIIVESRGGVLLLVITIFVCLMVSLVYAQSAFSELYNPGYWAFQQILSTLKN